MKALLISVASIDHVFRAIGLPLNCFISTEAGDSAAAFQESMDQFFEDGFIPQKVCSNLRVIPLTRGAWEASFSLVNCNSLDDFRVALCQPLLQWYFMGCAGSDRDLERFKKIFVDVIQERKYAAIDEVFEAALPEFSESEGLQIWSAGDVGIGERPSFELVVTGSARRLLEAEKKLKEISGSDDFRPTFAMGDGSMKWLDLSHARRATQR